MCAVGSFIYFRLWCVLCVLLQHVRRTSSAAICPVCVLTSDAGVTDVTTARITATKQPLANTVSDDLPSDLVYIQRCAIVVTLYGLTLTMPHSGVARIWM